LREGMGSGGQILGVVMAEKGAKRRKPFQWTDLVGEPILGTTSWGRGGSLEKMLGGRSYHPNSLITEKERSEERLRVRRG